MEDIVAIKVTNRTGRSRFLLTWGRVFDSVDPKQLLDAVRPHLSLWGLEGARRLAVCETVQEAASEPYFFEAFFAMAQERVPHGASYRPWKARKRVQIQKGKEIHYLGKRT